MSSNRSITDVDFIQHFDPDLIDDISTVKIPKLLVLTDFQFLLRKDENDQILPQVSDLVIKQCLEKYDYIITWQCHGFTHVPYERVEEQFRPYLTSGRIMIFKEMIYLYRQIATLLNMPTTRSPALILRSKEFIEHSLLITAEEYTRAGVTADKEMSFQDIVRERQKRGVSW